jgi:hypothetical protein
MEAVLTVEAASGLSPLSVGLLEMGLGRLVRFCAAHGAVWVDEITPEIAVAFIEAPKRGGGSPAASTQIQRRWVIRRMFSIARERSAAVGDPTLDTRPLDSPSTCHRGLTDGEIESCRIAALGHPDRRLLMVQMVAEAGASTVEIAAVTPSAIGDGVVHLAGTRGLRPRTNSLTGWGSGHVARLDSDVWPSTGGDYCQSRQAASYLTRKLLVAAGVWPQAGVSIDAVLLWRTHQILADQGFLAAAAFTGMNSLDQLALRLGVTW